MKKVLCLLLTFALLCGLAAPAFAFPPVTGEALTERFPDGFSENPNAYEIYPVPHSVTYSGTKFTPTEEINVVAEAGIDLYTTAFLREILTNYGHTVTVTNAVDSTKTNILLGVHGSGSVVDTYAAGISINDTDLFTRIDPYLLNVDTTANTNGTVTILGLNTDCVYYGLATLQMMFSSFAGKYFLPVQIEDYSSVVLRGFIEGFYGGFDYAGRESQMRSIRDVKGNIYVFASKTDSYHYNYTNQYPQEELDQIKVLVDAGLESKVRYAWSFHVGKSGFFNNAAAGSSNYDTRVASLKAKFQQLYDIGVRDFHLLNDDYNSGTNADVVALCNEINAWLKAKGDCGPLVYCPKGYNVSWAGDGSELVALKALDSDIFIYWTGGDVNTPITQQNITWPYGKSEHYPVTWLNYPCSEHGKSGIFLGNINHYIKDADGITGQMGIISNPVNYPEANKVAYFQLLSWGWNHETYTTYQDELWENCFKYLQPEVYDAYLTLARNISNCPGSGRVPAGFPESEYLKDILASVQAKALSGESLSGDDVNLLSAEFNNILASIEEFRESCENTRLVSELNPWIDSLFDVATGGKYVIEGLKAYQQGDMDGAWIGLATAGSAMSTWDQHVNPVYPGNPPKAGSLRLEPFVTKLIDYLTPLITPAETVSNPTFYAVMGGAKQSETANSDKMFDGNESTYAAFGVNQKADDYYGMDLGAVRTVTAISILQGKDDEHHDFFHKATLETSIDGENWTTLVPVVNSVRIEVSELNLAARYVRLRLLETGYGSKGSHWTNVREFTIDSDASEAVCFTNVSAVGASASYVNGLYTLDIPGGVTLAQGEYIGIALPEIMGIADIITSAGDLTLEYSTNGLTWTDTALSAPASMRYIRVINKGISPAAAPTSLAAEPSAKSIAWSVTNSSLTASSGNGWSNAFDGDLSTFAITTDNQADGKYVTFDLGAAMDVHDIALYFPENGDTFQGGKVYLSADGTAWGDPVITVADLQEDMDFQVPYWIASGNGGGVSARYLKLELTGSENKLKLFEITVNEKHQNEASLGAFSGTPGGDFSAMMDGNISSFFVPGEISGDSSYTQYLFSSDHSPSSIRILQSPTAMSNAEVTVQKINGSWETLGTLNSANCAFDTSELAPLNALRLNWVDGTSPSIAEILLLGVDLESAKGEAPLPLPSIYEPRSTAAAISVNNGTPLAMAGLPVQAQVAVSGGSDLNNPMEITLPVTWTCDDYDEDTAGKYVAIGNYVLPEGLTNPGCFTLTAEITVKRAADEPPEVITGNIALNKTVYVSGVEVTTGDYPAGAVDGNSTTRWNSNHIKQGQGTATDISDAWIVVDLGEGDISITDIVMEFHAKIWPTEYLIQAAGEDFIPTDYRTANIGKKPVAEMAEGSLTGQNAIDDTCWTTIKTGTASGLSDNPIMTVESFDTAVPEGIRYLRVYFSMVNAAAAGHTVGLRELTVNGTFTTSGEAGLGPTENLALERPVEVSGYEPGGAQGNAACITNGTSSSTDISERWSSGYMKGSGLVEGVQTPAWLIIDLGADVAEISSIKAYYHAKVWPTDYEVQTSSDNSTWTTVASITRANSGTTNPIDEFDTFSPAIPEDTRYLRLYFNTLNTDAAGHCVAVKEVEVFGKRDTSAPAVNPDIVSAAPLTATGVKGIAFTNLVLPGKAVFTLKDGTTVTLPVTWDDSSYDDTADSQTVYGAPDLSGTGITNDDTVEAALTLTLTAPPEVISATVNPTGTTVELGTAFGSISMPAQAAVQLDNGFGEICNIIWNSDDYDAQELGVQTVSGALALPSGVANTSEITAGFMITVEDTIAPTAPENFEATNVADTSIALRWDAAADNGTISAYVISGSGFTTQTVTGTSATITGLTPETEYTFRLVARDAAGNVSADVELTETTIKRVSSPSGPSTVTYRITEQYLNAEDNAALRTATSAIATKGSAYHKAAPAIEGYVLKEITIDGKTVTSATIDAVNAKADVIFYYISDDGKPQDGGSEPGSSGFVDVPADAWYKSSVDTAAAKGLLVGTSETHFSPNAPVTRATMMTILYRLNGGSEVTTGENWYAPGAAWAVETGVSDGTNLMGEITREQMITMLYRYIGSPEDEWAEPDFADAEKISAWATDAVHWAIAFGLLTGKTGNLLDPQGILTRAEAAAILVRFDVLFDSSENP